MMIDWTAITAAFALGLFSSAHCVGMCGGIMGALSMAIPANAKARRWFILLGYNFGRILSYTLMGVLVGLFARQIAESGGLVWLRWLAGLLLIAMGLYLANWWRGLTYIEAAGRYLWVYLQPLGKSLMPVNHPAKALLLGGIWGWLPCGLVYSTLAYAMTQGTGTGAGAVMLAFGFGTLPSVLATGIAAQQFGRLLQRPGLRWGLALLVILFGLWTIWGGGHNHHTGDHHHSGHAQHSHEMHQPPSAILDHSAHEHMPMMDHSHEGHLEIHGSKADHSTAGQSTQSSSVSSIIAP